MLGGVGEEWSRAVEALARPMDSLIRGVFCTFCTHWRFAFAVPMKCLS